jgi:hypothetical protein
MEIGIAVDNTVPLHIPSFVEFINVHASAIHCHSIKEPLRFTGRPMVYRTEVSNLTDKFSREIKKYEISFLITTIRFENNFFYSENDGVCIISFSHWHELTSIPMSNGVAYFICQ